MLHRYIKKQQYAGVMGYSRGISVMQVSFSGGPLGNISLISVVISDHGMNRLNIVM